MNQQSFSNAIQIVSKPSSPSSTLYQHYFLFFSNTETPTCTHKIKSKRNCIFGHTVSVHLLLLLAFSLSTVFPQQIDFMMIKDSVDKLWWKAFSIVCVCTVHWKPVHGALRMMSNVLWCTFGFCLPFSVMADVILFFALAEDRNIVLQGPFIAFRYCVTDSIALCIIFCSSKDYSSVIL